jgi:NADPH:quinone reductase-like Zn-dependent oxidoreductase
MADEDAATLGVGITTVGQSLYQALGLPLPGSGIKAGFPILIYGGSSATGTLAIQYARLSGSSPIITTCSPGNFDLVKSLGADAVFDYRDPDCVQKIREYTNGTLMHVLDCIANGPTIDICSAALSTGGKVVYLLSSAKHTREDVQPLYTLGYTVIGEYFRFSVAKKEYPPRPEDYEFGKMFWALSEKLLADGQIRAHPTQVGSGGLKGVFDGLQAMREGKVSGAKLVYRIEDTP